MRRFLDPFMIGTGILVGVLIGSVAYRGAAASLPEPVEKAAFVLLAFLFVYSLLDVVAIARNLIYHAELRVRVDEVEGRGAAEGEEGR